MALFRRLLEPAECFGIVPLHTESVSIHQPNLLLCIRESEFSGFFIPYECLRVINIDANAFVICNSYVMYCI